MARPLVPVMTPLPLTPPTAAVSFTFERRPESATHVHLEAFDGPLALLLSLIEQRQLDVLTVRLGDLAGAYLEALARLPGRLALRQLVRDRGRAAHPDQVAGDAAAPAGAADRPGAATRPIRRRRCAGA